MASQDFASANIMGGQVNSLIKILGGREVVMGILSGNLKVTLEQAIGKWKGIDGEFTLKVESDYVKGPEWIPRLESKNRRVPTEAKVLLMSSAFSPTRIEYDILIVRVNKGEDRVAGLIVDKARESGAQLPTLETACLVRELLTDDDILNMGFSELVFLHTPVRGENGMNDVFVIDLGRTGNVLTTRQVTPDSCWTTPSVGFVFITKKSIPPKMLVPKRPTGQKAQASSC